MRIHRSGPEHIAMYIEGAEVAARGWQELDETHVRSLTDTALDELGLRSSPHMIESYAAADGGALIFVSLRDGTAQTAYYAFADADSLLDAIRTGGTSPDAARCYRYDGMYILALDGSELPQGGLPHLCEFGVRLRAGSLLEAVLAEHGTALCCHSKEAAR